MVCVCRIMFCLRSSHSWETCSLCSSISKSSRCVCMSLCMWDVYILFSSKVLSNFQCGNLFSLLVVGCCLCHSVEVVGPIAMSFAVDRRKDFPGAESVESEHWSPTTTCWSGGEHPN